MITGNEIDTNERKRIGKVVVDVVFGFDCWIERRSREMDFLYAEACEPGEQFGDNESSRSERCTLMSAWRSAE